MKRAKLLWIDLEMTGLDPKKDKILEVAAIATDMNFREVGRFEATVRVDENLMRSRMVGPFWDKNSASRDALFENNKNGNEIEKVEQALLDFIKEHFKDDEVYLAGNSIHQDRRFIDSEMPRLNARLHYRMLDVSAWKIYFEKARSAKFVKPEDHRAMSDIEGSIAELKYYLTFLK